MDENKSPETPPESNEHNDEEFTATYIPGEPQASQPQTIAQLFVTLSPLLRFLILAIIVLVVLAIVYWILSPKAEQAGNVLPGTETAVVTNITPFIPPTDTVAATATPRIYIESETAIAQSAPVGSPTPIIYVVQKGDTLNKVARLYGVTVQDIVTLNNIFNPNSIPIGQELLIPTPGSGTSIPVHTASAGSPPMETPAAPPAETAVSPSPTPLPELVIRGIESVELRIAAGTDYQAITTLPQGTFVTIIAKTPAGDWYLVQLEDGFTRGWIPAAYTGIIYPGDPNTIPTTPRP
ncbi:MAG: hypothetical protein CSA11_00680 [Chloroflexi bacterium]|nr:MAG: hypothetical protein CSB13_07940 [Chloroflexota bacterium]PIE82383.1 MAG: hypothetical protein CSA11_00680 [Chloroflexota bacterium]